MREPDGFREFVAGRSPSLLRTAWMLTGDAVSAEDLLQTALARTWPHWSRVRQGHPEAYVRQVMVRTNASWRSRFWTREKSTDLTSGSDGIPPLLYAEQDRSGQIIDRLVLMDALATLPVRQRQSVVLRYFDDLSVEAVAEIMGCSAGTVKSQTAKGLARLRDVIGQDTLIKEEL
ncbi:SigE family RNA polymerase sigma factor [Ornithinimicrobium cryptoxanthini]|uniref:SigE family RNA polymerase sigma factor n=1 Tax=Ornithinimicrobium cryptoxanthini TaxID=2934161 RepID=A0ABY4YLE9_9MICO|nr:SigE family RNA polymerase sigma factor [Ornithinimicrobium cryptoxanthini]USQ77434.1 SigE family RNA polymerase sigma factor [Ornithinimicrobium cryptoxanthini]